MPRIGSERTMAEPGGQGTGQGTAGSTGACLEHPECGRTIFLTSGFGMKDHNMEPFLVTLEEVPIREKHLSVNTDPDR